MPATTTPPPTAVDTLSPVAAARELGRRVRTVRNWITCGVRLPDGSRVRLTASRLGGLWSIRRDDLQAFVSRCTAAALPADSEEQPPVPVPCPGKADPRRAFAALDRMRAARARK
jgi:hypothetical protein